MAVIAVSLISPPIEYTVILRVTIHELNAKNCDERDQKRKFDLHDENPTQNPPI
eukprot:m.344915 g.344915  ORF g.344915 m.344915 type:complete len:54 (+) comp25397_c0_seq1:797-958(+)